MPDPSLLEAFPTPVDTPFVVEHVAEEFTSLCPKTGHPDFGEVVVAFEPAAGGTGGLCVELKSLKLYLHAFRDRGIFYEHSVNSILDDLVAACRPRSMTVVGHFNPRGGITSKITARMSATG